MVARASEEYLVAHGSAGEFGRFQTPAPLGCRRGDRVVVESRRGLELGVVLCAATPRQARLLHETPVGRLLRAATADDEEAARRMRDRARLVFEDGRRLAAELRLPLEILDVEVALDGHQATIQFLGSFDCDLNPLASALAGRHNLFVLLHNLALPAPPEEPAGCGEPNCGQASGGGCTNCGTGGGCATGCGAGAPDMTAYFAHLRDRMEKRNLTPLA